MASIRRTNTRYSVMPYAYGDYILTCGEITYQSFRLDKTNRGIHYEKISRLAACKRA